MIGPRRFASRGDPVERGRMNNIPAARRLRREGTQTETLLWQQLRNCSLDGLKFRRQHAIGRFVVDFYCDDIRLAVEIDGGVHRDPEQHRRDHERQVLLEQREIAFVRISTEDVLQRLPWVLDLLRSEVRARGSFSQRNTLMPPPFPQRRERGPGGEGPCA